MLLDPLIHGSIHPREFFVKVVLHGKCILPEIYGEKTHQQHFDSSAHFRLPLAHGIMNGEVTRFCLNGMN